MPTALTQRFHDDVTHCSDRCTKGLLKDARSDVQEVLEDGMERKVGEGRKEGNGNHLTASDIYIITQSRLWKRTLNGMNEWRRKTGWWLKEVCVWLIANGPVLGISSKCGFSPILFSVVDICSSARSGAEQVFTGPDASLAKNLARFPSRIRIDHWWQIISESINSSISKTCEQVADVYHLHISRATWHHWHIRKTRNCLFFT